MKTLGTDISLDVCKGEGYLMVQFDARRKFTKNLEVRFIRYWPDYDKLAGEILVDTFSCLSDVWGAYQGDKKGIDSFADMDYNDINEISDIYTFLHFADSVDAYNGFLSW